MEKDILEILEFNEIRKKLAELAPSALSKKMALELLPSSVPEVVEKACRKRKKHPSCWKGKSPPPWEKPMTFWKH